MNNPPSDIFPILILDEAYCQKCQAVFGCHKHNWVRPLQFNYLSYELFLEKKSCQTPKKKEKKSHLWCLTDESGFEIFCQTS